MHSKNTTGKPNWCQAGCRLLKTVVLHITYRLSGTRSSQETAECFQPEVGNVIFTREFQQNLRPINCGVRCCFPSVLQQVDDPLEFSVMLVGVPGEFFPHHSVLLFWFPFERKARNDGRSISHSHRVQPSETGFKFMKPQTDFNVTNAAGECVERRTNRELSVTLLATKHASKVVVFGQDGYPTYFSFYVKIHRLRVGSCMKIWEYFREQENLFRDRLKQCEFRMNFSEDLLNCWIYVQKKMGNRIFQLEQVV